MDAIVQKPMLTRSQNKMEEILSLLKEPVEEPPYKQPDTADMSELESDESTDQVGQRLKILTPSEMLSRLPISFAQLKAGKSQKT